MGKTLIIAEAGVNHNGDIIIAKKLAQAAKDCGADIVKFQTWDLDGVVSRYAQMAEYQKENIGEVKSQKEMLQELSLNHSEFVELSEYCRNTGIEFLSTPFDVESARFLQPMVRLWKIPSGEITNWPYLVEIARTGKPVIMSTGMSDMDEIGAALDVLKENGAGEISLLHCNTQYPTPYEDVNLRAINTLAEHFRVKVGYSDHTQGIEAPVAAVAMGAWVIEKHFTLDKNMEGPDHKASLEPTELKAMVDAIRHIEAAMGDGVKKVTQSERPNQTVARKSIIAARDIQTGELLTEENLTTKRPGSGISPMRWKDVIGTRAVRNFAEDELIEL